MPNEVIKSVLTGEEQTVPQGTFKLITSNKKLSFMRNNFTLVKEDDTPAEARKAEKAEAKKAEEK